MFHHLCGISGYRLIKAVALGRLYGFRSNVARDWVSAIKLGEKQRYVDPKSQSCESG